MRVAMALAGSDWGRSGIGIYLREVLPRLIGRLRARGDTLLAFGTGRDLSAYAEVLDGAERARLPALLDRAGASALFHLTFAGAYARLRSADVLLLPAANRRLTLRAPLPTVAVVHDLAQLHVARKYDPLRQAYVRFVVTHALGRSDRLVAVSDATRRDLAETLGRDGSDIRVVLNGVDFERFEPMAADSEPVLGARAATGLQGPYVLYASRLEHPGKNHLRLLRAFAASRARDTHVLALAGKDWGAGSLIEEEQQSLGLGDRVRLLGFVDDEHLAGLVAGADAVGMVGLREGFGLPALEALAAGRPVFASSAGALPEVVGPLGALCDPLDEGAIRAALERALFEEDFRERASAQGPAWAAERGWDRTVEGLLEACDEAVAR